MEVFCLRGREEGLVFQAAVNRVVAKSGRTVVASVLKAGTELEADMVLMAGKALKTVLIQ